MIPAVDLAAASPAVIKDVGFAAGGLGGITFYYLVF